MSIQKVSGPFTWPSSPPSGLSNSYSITASCITEVWLSVVQSGTITAGATIQIFVLADGHSPLWPLQTFGAPASPGTYFFPPYELPSTAQYVAINYTPATGPSAVTTLTDRIGQIYDS